VLSILLQHFGWHSKVNVAPPFRYQQVKGKILAFERPVGEVEIGFLDLLFTRQFVLLECPQRSNSVGGKKDGSL
jgi:hypothetical protein